MSATVTAVASSATSGALLAARPRRKGGCITNASTAILYLLYGTGTASSSNYSVALAAGAYHEILKGYTGDLTGVWVSANGNALVTELT